MSDSAQTIAPSQNCSIVNNVSQTRLPKIELPIFSGANEDWYTYRDSFEKLIHTNSTLNSIQKFHYLRSSLKGNAANIINSLDITEANYNEAWALLEERYDNKRRIMQAHIKTIFELPTILKENSSGLRNLLDNFSKHLRALKALDRPVSSWDDLVIYLMLSKLDHSTQREWETSRVDSAPSTFKQLNECLMQRCNALEATSVKIVSSGNNSNSRFLQKTKHAASHVAAIQQSCICCKQQHQIYYCDAFRKLPVQKRYKFIKNANLCLNCLETSNHQTKDCQSGTCRKCNKAHNTLLHFDNSKETICRTAELPISEMHENTVPVVTQCSSIEQNSHRVLLSIAIVFVFDSRGERIACRALLDSGSQLNFITESLSKKLKLRKRTLNLAIAGITQDKRDVKHSLVVQLQSRCNAYQEKVDCIILPKITQRLPQEFVAISEFNIPANIALADPNFNVPAEIDLLIGAELFWNLICVGQIKSSNAYTIFQKTKLGWIVSGRTYSDKRSVNPVCHLSTFESLNETMLRFWSVENLFNVSHHTAEERVCETHFLQNVVRNSEGRFVVKLPVKLGKFSQLGNSFEIAKKRFLALERRLVHQQDAYQDYRSFLNEYIKLGHMREVPVSNPNQKMCYYIPHHAVFKQSSSTTKLRVVFDASCKTDSGISLNDALMVGPILQEDLFLILSRFRTYPIAITADVAKMYRQVLLADCDRSLQRILWRNTPNDELKVFQLSTVTYGTASASFLAIRALRELASVEQNSFPLGSQIVKRDFYVDDLVSGAFTIREAEKLKFETTNILKKGGFELRKWFSNASSLCDKSEPGMDKVFTVGDDTNETRTLGIAWSRSEDSFHFSSVNTMTLGKPTKRNILSRIALIFDPLGLLGPVIVTAKIIMQQLWLLKIDWDESIPADMSTKWCINEEQLKSLSNFIIPRRIISIDAPIDIQLHGFADASQEAYGACVYLRSITPSREVQVRLVASKSRVAPVKSLSIPRLELSAALLLAQLVKKLQGCLNLKFSKVTLWTDSTIVLHWLQGSSRNWTTFVANRVGEIQSITCIDQWRHVGSKDNPANPLSRGVMPADLKELKIWWNGPDSLLKSEEGWPQFTLTPSPENIPERRQALAVNLGHALLEWDIFDRFSCCQKLIRVFAYVLRFIKNCKNKTQELRVSEIRRCFIGLFADELQDFRIKLVQIVQSYSFSDDIKTIFLDGSVHRKSKILKLNPFMDTNGILRVGGRLKHALIPYESRHPSVLPGKHRFTKLLIIHEHNRLLHAGPQTTLSAVRQKYWPICARKIVRQLVKKCIVCVRNSPTLARTLMADLPQNRVKISSKPFEQCGVDFAGPIFYKEGRRKSSKRIKCYVAVFVCFTTKSVHIELAVDLSAETFIGVLKRFISRTGRPSDIFSDNGTNFVGAARELRELYELFRTEDVERKIRSHLSNEGINWHFIIPRAPHMGGLWEAAVKSAKFHLKRIVGEASLYYDELNTLLIEIESVLNSRPLSPLSVDPNDMTALTAGHFLIGCSLIAYPEPSLLDLKSTHLSRWQRIEQMRQHFWQRWSKEYLHHLQQRTKWRTHEPPVKIGQLVILKENDLPPLSWILGRIQEIYPGSDGIVRSVMIHTAKGNYKRPVSRICVLPLD